MINKMDIVEYVKHLPSPSNDVGGRTRYKYL